MTKRTLSESNLPSTSFIRPRNSDKDEPVTFTWTAVGRDGRSHDFFQTFTPGHGRKLPGPTADRVMRALLSMHPDESNQEFEIRTSINRLIEICNLKSGGETYDRIRRAINRLQGVTIKTNAFWDYERQEYMDASCIELFAHHHFNTMGSKKMVRVQWTSAVMDLLSTWTKPVDLDHLFQLDTCLARKLYQVSALNIYQQGEMIEDLKLLCHGQLGISQNRSAPSALKQSLNGAVKALRAKKLIDIEFEKDEKSPSIKSDWLVQARPMKGMLDLQEDIDDPQYWAFQLFGRGIMDSEDDPLDECREWVDKEGVSRARSAARNWDRSGGEDSAEEASNTDVQRHLSELSRGRPSRGRERTVEEKITIFLQLIDPDKHGRLHRRARRYIDENHPGLESNRRHVLANKVAGRIYLAKEGPESILDPLADQLE